ncbi:MAG: DNA-directed RNA polymerase subunit beta', partial [bacterium]|nr:DNA-directed RNA polymerase subunit beta' [bacterium]
MANSKPADHLDPFKNILDFKSLQIKLASPDVIKAWSYGEITKPETINYRTLKPEKDGLFDERIFGPVKDWECYCGKYKRIRYKGIICDKCGVEVTQSRVRRERMGHITLAAPVAHVWYFKGAPSKLSLLLDVSPKALESVVYFAQFIVTDLDPKGQTEAVNRLQKEAETAKNEIRKNTQNRIAEMEKGIEKEAKQLRSATNLNDDSRALALDQLQLKTKQQTQALREAEIPESQKIDLLYQRLTDIVKTIRPAAIISEDEYNRLAEHGVVDFIDVGMGAESILQVISKIDVNSLVAQLREEVVTSSGQRHIKATKRLRVADGLRRAGIDPAWMILKVLPVIPPDLRPMVQLSGGRFATSDLNDLYRRVINRNHRLRHLIDLGAPEIILRNEKRMLQEAVDSLIDSTQHAARTRRAAATRPRSLSDMLRGKQGRFRQNLLGKRVDYSGRSVIVVGPELRLNQCGLPKEMALEMFKPFVLRQMIVQGLAPNVKSAKNLLETRPPEVFDILEEITKNHPVLLNRAPTLHKLSIQAFYPVLIEGSAIRIHPCICAGFNADFDGDQMAVHVPISAPALEEARTLMTPEQNLRKPADGAPITIPSTKEMALGNYYLTSIDAALEARASIFATPAEAVLAYHLGQIKARQAIKVNLGAEIVDTSVGRILFNEILPEGLRFVNEPVRRSTVVALFNKAFKLCSTEEISKLVDAIKNIGFWSGTISGLSVSITDSVLVKEKDEIIAQANQRVAEIGQNYAMGLITVEEKRRLSQE